MKPYLLALAGAAVLALGGAAAALAIRTVPATTPVTVTVTEREYRISLSTKTPPAGPVRLVVHNAGHVAHALSISGPGLATRTTGTIRPGATKTLRVTLGGGTFTVWCPIGSHAASGMKASLTVRGAVLPPVGTSTGAVTDPMGGGYDGGGYGY
jgi:plastocyanin